MKGLIFTYLLTYGGAAASLFNPFVGLLIYVCFSILKPDGLWHWSVPKGNYSRVVALGLLVGWAISGFGNWKFGRARGVVFALLGYLMFAALSALLAPDQSVAWTFVESQAKIVLPFIVGITTLNSVKQLRQLAWVITLSMGYLALEMNRSYFAGFNVLTDQDDFLGMDNNCFAIAMVTCAGLAFFLGLEAHQWWLKLLAYFIAGCMVHVILFSMSRGGMVGLVLVGCMSFWLMPKQGKHYLLFALAVAAGLYMAGPQVRDRFLMSFADEKTRDSSAQSRIDMWGACRDAMIEHPFLGLGPDHFPLVMPQRYGYRQGLMAHSLWLQMGADIGVPGMLCLMGFYSLCCVRIWGFTRETSQVADPWFRGAGRMVIASLIGFAVSAQFVSLHGLEVPFYVTLIGAGVLKLNSTRQIELAVRPAAAMRPLGTLAAVVH